VSERLADELKIQCRVKISLSNFILINFFWLTRVAKNKTEHADHPCARAKLIIHESILEVPELVCKDDLFLDLI
jgi:hypothetical protein